MIYMYKCVCVCGGGDVLVCKCMHTCVIYIMYCLFGINVMGICICISYI